MVKSYIHWGRVINPFHGGLHTQYCWISTGIQGFDPQPHLPLIEGRWMFLRLQSFERIAMLLVSPPCLGHDQLRGGKQDEQRLRSSPVGIVA